MYTIVSQDIWYRNHVLGHTTSLATAKYAVDMELRKLLSTDNDIWKLFVEDEDGCRVYTRHTAQIDPVREDI